MGGHTSRVEGRLEPVRVQAQPQRLPPLAQQQPRQPRETPNSSESFRPNVRFCQASEFYENHQAKLALSLRNIPTQDDDNFKSFFLGKAVVVTPTSAPAGRWGQCNQVPNCPLLCSSVAQGTGGLSSPCPFIQILIPSEMGLPRWSGGLPAGPCPWDIFPSSRQGSVLL